MTMQEISLGIKGLDKDAAQAALNLQNALVKPAGSLGVLEEISVQIAGITGKLKSNVDKRLHVVFGSDNGIYQEGVAAAPQFFTNFLMCGYASGKKCGINTLCEYNGVELRLVDMGIIGEISYENVYNRRLMPNGTNNFRVEKAMSRETAIKAVEVGIEFAKMASEEGYEILGVGEVGMGNTSTAAACILAVLHTEDADKAIGRGAGLSDEAYGIKKKVIKEALAKHKPDSGDIFDILSKVGGLDIAAMTGMFIGAAYYRKPIIVDGVIAIAAALLAYIFNPLTKEFMIPSHISEEPAYILAAKKIGLKPILNLNMRLGEGTGCPLTMGIVGNAMAIINNMNTFEEVNLTVEYRKGLKN